MSKFTENVRRYIKLHKELHGIKNFKKEAVAGDLASSFDYDPYECLLEVQHQENNYNSKYGLFIARAMPFHIGHNAIIQDIIRDGRIPVILLGGKNKTDERHPLTYKDRVKLIKKVYPSGCKFIGLEDKDDWTEWFNNVIESLASLNIEKEQIVLYSHNKEIDRTNFEYNGKKYKNSFYSKMFEENDFEIKQLEEFVDKKGKVVHASNIRKDKKYAERNLDARVYMMLKEQFNWWK